MNCKKTIMELLTAIAVFSVYSIKVQGACDLVSRIKSIDNDVTVTQVDQPCALTLTAGNNKQVVVVMYDMVPDCVEKATVAIYDGDNMRNILITNVCHARPWSFASRTHSLTLKPVSDNPLRQFSLDIHVIETTHTFIGEMGNIQSQRYLGEFSEGSLTNTTPNNFHGIYTILLKTNVTKLLTFQEFRIHGSTGQICKDYVQIITPTSTTEKLCGDNNVPAPFSTQAKNVTIEFVTDNITTYTGFTAQYKDRLEETVVFIVIFSENLGYSVCRKEVNEASGIIDFEVFNSVDNMVCAYIISVRKDTKITIFLTFGGKGKCIDILEVSSMGKTFIPSDCGSDSRYNGSFRASKDATLRFTFNKTQYVKGNFSTEIINQQDNNKDPSTSAISDSNAGGPSGINNVVIPVVVSLLAVVVVAVVVVVIVILRRRLQNEDKTYGARYKTDMDDIEVYEDNADYDQLHQNRDHKPTSNDKNSNIYGAAPSPRDVYAVVNKIKKGMDLQPTEEYDQQEFGNEYDETVKTKSNITAKNENLYE